MIPGIHKFLYFFIFFIFSFSIEAAPIKGSGVEIQILNKISAKVTSINIKVGNSIFFDSLKIQIFSCYKNPPEEVPEDFVLLEIYDDVNLYKKKLVYKGWMISSSPATTPFEHPIYDLWIRSCNIEIDF